MIQEGCKIVRLTNDPEVFISAFGDGKEYKYELNIPTIRNAEDGPFAVFTTLQAAKNFLANYNFESLYVKRAIFKCKYIQSNDNKLWYTDSNHEKIMDDSIGIIALPIGTGFADEVMLIEEII